MEHICVFDMVKIGEFNPIMHEQLLPSLQATLVSHVFKVSCTGVTCLQGKMYQSHMIFRKVILGSHDLKVSFTVITCSICIPESHVSYARVTYAFKIGITNFAHTAYLM